VAASAGASQNGQMQTVFNGEPGALALNFPHEF
jgi:hypothetical protein